MKRSLRWTLVLLCLLLPCAVRAEFFTKRGDIYYHAVRNCMGIKHGKTISEDSGRYPCPVCVQDDYGYPGLEVFRVDGLTVVRMSDSWMAAQTDTQDIFAGTPTETFRGKKAERTVAKYLHGEDYAAFRRAVRKGETVSAVAREIENFDRDTDLCGEFHVGAAWYAVYGRMTYPPLRDRDWTFRFFFGDMKQSGSRLKLCIDMEWDDYFVNGFEDPVPVDIEDAPSWSGTVNGCEAKLFEAHNFHLLSLRLSGADALAVPKLKLQCEGWPEPVSVTGALAGDGALYGVILSEGQAAQIKDGRPLSVSYRTFGELTRDSFGGTPYAVLEDQRESRDFLVADRKGTVILPRSNWIKRNGNVFLSVDPEPREAYEAIGAMSEDGVYTSVFSRCSLWNADTGSELLRGRYVFGSPSFSRGCLSHYTWISFEIFREGKESPALTLREGKEFSVSLTGVPNPAQRFVVSGSAAIYAGSMSEILKPWFDSGHPDVPENCLVGVFNDGFTEIGTPAAVVIWSLDGSEPLTPDALGMAGANLSRVD